MLSHTHTLTHSPSPVLLGPVIIGPGLSGRWAPSSPACASTPLHASPAEGAAPLGKQDCSRTLTREWGHRKDLCWSPHASSAWQQRQRSPFLDGQPGPPRAEGSPGRGLCTGVGGAAPQAGGQRHSRLGRPEGHGASTRTPACCFEAGQGNGEGLQRTMGSCNPW